MYLVIKICICYNAVRQRNVEKSMQAKNESPDRNGVQSRDSSFLFIVAKHPLDYLLPLPCLSSHLLMRRQTCWAWSMISRKMWDVRLGMMRESYGAGCSAFCFTAAAIDTSAG